MMLASLAVLPMPLLLGYGVRVVRAALGRSRLPEWKAWGRLYLEGAGALLITLAHLAPLALALWALLREDVTRGSEPSASSLLLVVFLVVPLALALGLHLHMAQLRFAALRRLRAAFEVGENLELLRRSWGNVGRLLVVQLATELVSQLGLLLCCVGVFPAGFWALCTHLYALGELGRCDHYLSRGWAEAAPRS